MLSIQTNMSSLEAQNNLNSTESQLNTTIGQLSSGFRITSAGVDAAGLGISSDLEAQIASYTQAGQNAQDGLSLVQTGEGAMNQTTALLTRLRELAMESASSGIGNTQRGYIQTEVGQVTSEIDRIANSTEYDGTKLLNSAAGNLTFQVGIRDVAANDQISVSTVDVTATTLGVKTLDLSTQANAQAALATIDTAIQSVSTAQASFGAAGNRLQSAVSTIASDGQSLSAADSRIKDVDVAKATSAMSREQVLMQAGVSVLAQANQMPQVALKLLG